MERATTARRIAPFIVGLLCAMVTQASAQQGASAVPVKHLPDEPHRQAPAAPQDRRGGPREGLTVHGHWTLEVRNPDGTVGGRYEFDNSLSPPGPETSPLSLLLTGRSGMAGWAIIVTGSPNLCVDSLTGQLLDCISDNSGNAAGGANLNLIAAVIQPTSTTPLALGLTGSVKVQSSGQIVRVATRAALCPNTSVTCTADAGKSFSGPTFLAGSTFTSRDLSGSPIAVAAGQTVLVTVVISFS